MMWKHFNRRLVALSLALLLLLTMPQTAWAAKKNDPAPEPVIVTVTTAEELAALSEACRLDSYSAGLVVSLAGDIDLTGSDFAPIPIFAGTFLGNGHTVKGLTLTADGSVQGFFRYLTVTAEVSGLTVEGTVAPGGSANDVGGIVGENSGKITDCAAHMTIAGNSRVGGIAGTNRVTGTIDGCTVTGSIRGDHSVGGIAGLSGGVIRGCTNEASINVTPRENTVEVTDITLDTLTGAESSATVTDIGGIAGTTSGIIRDCVNRGSAGYPHMGYNIGGIAGTQSGYITGCENHGAIAGRKEVGGIVGQMEPVTRVEYTKDTLQILQGQLNGLSAATKRASNNVQSGAGKVGGQMEQLRTHADTAMDAVQVLSDPTADGDARLAAQNSLSSSVSGMGNTANNMTAAVQGTTAQTVKDLNAISRQINAMSATLNGASENLGGTVKDVSDEDTADDLTGKVAACVNYGSVYGDLNAGGIAAAMAVENDFDQEEDIDIAGDSSMNFSGELRAVITDCTNEGTVTCRRRNAGGIVGLQTMGLVKGCLNTGSLDTAAAAYTGGIAGRSDGRIRDCSAKCDLTGTDHVGGIAGSGTIVTDCRSMVRIDGAAEYVGMILGNAEAADTEEGEAPLSANYYLPNDRDLGGIDGISYGLTAAPMTLEDFLGLEGLHEAFGTAAVTFRFADGREKTFTVAAGQSLPMTDVPPIPYKQGYVGRWSGLTEEALRGLLFDKTFDVVYTGQNTVIATAEVGHLDLPRLLLEGAFGAEAKVSAILNGDIAPDVGFGEQVFSAMTVTMTRCEGVSEGRVLLDVVIDKTRVRVMVCTEDGWQNVESVVDESYAVFPMTEQVTAVAVVQTMNYTPVWIGLAAVLALGAGLVYKRKRKKPAAASEELF